MAIKMWMLFTELSTKKTLLNICLYSFASSANRYTFANCLHISGKSLLYIINNMASRIVPCGIPPITSVHSEKSHLTLLSVS